LNIRKKKNWNKKIRKKIYLSRLKKRGKESPFNAEKEKEKNKEKTKAGTKGQN